MTTAEVSDFQFCDFKKFRVCSEFISSSQNVIPTAWNFVTTSSHYGITAVYTSEKKLVSFLSADVHRSQSSKSDVNAESKLNLLKATHLSQKEDSEVVALGSSCNGRVLSVLVNTCNGPFVYFYDFCALSPEQKKEAGLVQSIRLSATDSAKGVELQWNPTAECSFAVVTSDGTLSAYLVDLINPKKFTIVGTTLLKIPGTCISWSPKGKQLIVGDVQGNLHQFKPEMTLVRTIASPAITGVMKSSILRCVGVCWLSTTEFFIAYSQSDQENLSISLLCARKEGPPHWTCFDDVIYCSEQCPFSQRVFFVPLFQWNLILCASSRSSEVGVLGKLDGVWKMWSLNDNSRIELPLSHSQDESFPCGICFELSSQVSIRTDEDSQANGVLCPCVFIITSSGLLLSYSALWLKPTYPVINRKALSLPAVINFGSSPFRNLGSSQDAVQTSPFEVSSSVETHQTSYQTLLPKPHTTITPVGSPNVSSLASTTLNNVIDTTVVKTTLPSTRDTRIPTSRNNDFLSLQSTNKITATGNSGLALTNSLTIPQNYSVNVTDSLDVDDFQAKEENDLVLLRRELKNRLVLFEQKFADAQEANDWTKDLKSTLEKNVVAQPEKPYEFNEGELDEVRKIGCETEMWLKKVKGEISELKVAFDEQKKTVELAEKESIQPVSMKVLDFNNKFRLSKLKEAFHVLEEKLEVAEQALDDMADNASDNVFPSEDEGFMSPEEERKLCITVKSICKAIIKRRKQLSDLYQEFAELEALVKFNTKKRETSSAPSAKINVAVVKPGGLQRISFEEPVMFNPSSDFMTKRATLLSLLSKRAPCAAVPRKLKDVSQSGTFWSEKGLAADVSRLESRLIDAIALSHKKVQKKLMDVGTQSPSSLTKDTLNKENDTVSSGSQPGDYAATSTLGNFTGKEGPIQTASFFNGKNVRSSEVSAPNQSATPNVPTFNFLPNNVVTTSSIPQVATSTPSTSVYCLTKSTSITSTVSSHTSPGLTSSANSDPNKFLTKVFTDTSVTTTSTAPVQSSMPSQAVVPTSTTFDVSNEAATDKAENITSIKVPHKGFENKEHLDRKNGSSEGDITTTTSFAPSASVMSTRLSESTAKAVSGNGGDQYTTSSLTSVTTSVATTSTTSTQNASEVKTAKTPKSVSFSFTLPTTSPSTSVASTGSSLFGNGTGSNNIPISASQLDMDEGMDEETATSATSTLFSSAFSGLGSSTSSNINQPKSVFGSSASFGSNSVIPASSSLFGSLSKPKTGSVFGGTSATQTSSLFSTSAFNATSSSSTTSTPTSSLFSSTIAQSQQQQPSSLFGSKPAVSSTTTFGGAPTFGSKPTFGSTSPFGSAFSQSRPSLASTPASSGFSAFARGGTFSFGSLASSQQSAGSSVFGGSGFGALAAHGNAKPASVFGGGVNTTSSSSFSTWR